MKYTATIMVSFPVEGDTEAEALEQAQEYQYSLAESNDGSEMLANAKVSLTPA